MAVTFNTEKKEIYISDIGVTMRTLLAVAAQGMEECGNRRWHVVYKDARIGLVQVKDHNLKGVSNARPSVGTEKTSKRKTKLAEAFARASMDICERPPGEDG